jgi:PEP-CTERM motif
MRRSILIVAALTCMNAVWPDCQAGLIPIAASDFAPGAQVIDFETGTTSLPVISGVTFLSTASTSYPWFGGGAEFDSFGPTFGAQNWENLLGGTQNNIIYSGLGLDLATPVEAIGGYVAKVPNFKNLSPSQVIVELFDSSQQSLGTATITLNATVNSPVFFGFTASEPIASFTIVAPTAGAGFFGVDNFTYGGLQSVPEPSTLVLAGTAALAGLGTWSRRRRASQSGNPVRRPGER